MTVMQEKRQRIKRKLAEYQDISAEAEQIREELTRLEAKRLAPGTAKWDALPGGGSGTGDPVLNPLTQLERLEARYNAQLERLAKAQLEVEDMIEGLGSNERKLMRYRYIKGLKWEAVCVAMGYEWRQTHRIHAAALDKLVETEA